VRGGTPFLAPATFPYLPRVSRFAVGSRLETPDSAARGALCRLRVDRRLRGEGRDRLQKDAIGLDGALQVLAHANYGPYLLGLTAFGLLCYGLYCLVDARYRDVSVDGSQSGQDNSDRDEGARTKLLERRLATP
jgi:Domain of Unknown Function (DUF1206)